MAVPSDESTTDPIGLSTVTRYLRKYRGYLIVGAIVTILSNGLLLYNPLLIGQIFDKLESAAPMSDVAGLLWLMVGISIIAGVFRFLMRRSIIWMSRKIEYHLRGDIVSHLLSLPSSWYDRHRTGDVIARLTNDLEAVRQMSGPAIMQVGNTIVTVIVSLAFMISLSPILTLYALVPAIVLPFVVNRLSTLSHQRYQRIQEFFGTLTNTAQENLAGVRVVKAYGQESAEFDHFAGMSKRYFDLNMDMGKLQAMFWPLIAAVSGGLTLSVLYLGGLRVMDGEVSLGTLIAFFVYLNLLLWPVMALGWVVSLYQRGRVSLARINRVLAAKSDLELSNGPGVQQPVNGTIEFRNLHFAYETGPEVLSGIDLSIPAGSTLGIIGLTGSGKTTLISLIARQYPVAPGQLFVDGIDVNDWDIDYLRSQIGVATQEPFLFSETLRENLRFGRDGATDEQIAEAADTAALRKDIDSFADGFDTIVGERGITLSGGQKQRTAIARALLVNPRILILDDATSAVDTETDHEINERIHRRANRSTTLIISHRVSSVKESDRIIYLEDGRIVESGSHDELVALNGRYAELYRTQVMASEIEALT